ncbi:NADH-quinone oxidoreductase subunit L [Granulicella tundricola]|uniref:Proton-translocating NADH-quinone oxidoreductase, chain L n=1 Tax=Granulicella tundricola (strain ATCC BAA-1859 / DSM 23138 / MP5ACTX9) TaxID=1198114 RepID=E8X4N5_GRATM|nr:NADH-quinone oxidoreductase subunit L [Granulicella tundricola]ADW69445.1 proton-translocating NADH-quinone oxidoreductase, chain L [Granulicella tundricola MP5ACTX9]
MNPNTLWLIPLSPLLGFLINGTVGRKLPRPFVTAIALIATIIPAVKVFQLWLFMKFAADGPLTMSVVSRPWIDITNFHVDFALSVDHLTLIMLGVVTGVGFLIHLYAAGYMAHEDGYWRFFAYLNLFMFFMSVLVLADSFLLLFVGWEGVGLASYLLIGFYFTKTSAANAGKKAFILNRVGDFGFLLAMFLLIAHFGTLSFSEVFASITANPGLHGGFLTAIALLLLVGAAGKSAQIPLYVWLPDAMEGPTPVSALIHAATMVTAGVYMVARCHTLFDRSPFALAVVACIGAATAIFAACIALVQHDIKRVLAYSTVSQLGYMFLACGVGAYTAGIFHVLTHAFFKALLFLAAGSVIHALSGEQDMRVMGGLRKRIPVTFWTMTMGVFAIAGIPPLAGFFSKDEILFQAYSWTAYPALGKLLWLVGLITAGMTSFYMFRLWFKTFFGAERFDEHHLGDTSHNAEHDDSEATHSHGVHESSWIMLAPLVILAILSVVGGWVGVPAALGGHNEIEHFLEPVFASGIAEPLAVASHGSEIGLAAVSVITALLGFMLAYLWYYKKPGTAAALAQRFPHPYNLVANKFFVDEIYNAIFVTGLLGFTRIFLKGFDSIVVDGFGKFAGWVAFDFGEVTRRIQSGNIRSYAGWLALGAAAVMVVMIFGRFWV